MHYPNFADNHYLELGIVILVGGFHKPSLINLVGIWVKYEATIKSIRSNCIHSCSFSLGDKVQKYKGTKTVKNTVNRIHPIPSCATQVAKVSDIIGICGIETRLSLDLLVRVEL